MAMAGCNADVDLNIGVFMERPVSFSFAMVERFFNIVHHGFITAIRGVFQVVPVIRTKQFMKRRFAKRKKRLELLNISLSR
jgi:hypothetical protein